MKTKKRLGQPSILKQTTGFLTVICLSLYFTSSLHAEGWVNRIGVPFGDPGIDKEIILSTVNALACDSNGNLYAGGFFWDAGGSGAPGTPQNIARWNGSEWQALGTGMDDAVNALAVDGSGNLYAGGKFTTAGGVPANRVARWDGSAWSALGSGMDGEVRALTFDGNGNLYAGGHFMTAGGLSANHIARWDGSAWSALGRGTNGNVHALECDILGLYAGGHFTQAGGVSGVNNIAIWNGSAWGALGTGTNGDVFALECDGYGNLYVGGNFTNAGGVDVGNIAQWSFFSGPPIILDPHWSALGQGIEAATNGQVNAIQFGSSGVLFVGGFFRGAGSVDANYIVRWYWNTIPGFDPWVPVGDGTDYVVNALAYDGGDNMYVGGWFWAAGGNPSFHIARYSFQTNKPAVGYDADHVIPASEISQATDGTGNITVLFRIKDEVAHACTLRSFEYSPGEGASWFEPGDTSGSLSTGWRDNAGNGYIPAADWTGGIYSFTFNTKHADVSANLDNIERSDVKIRFQAHDGVNEGLFATTEPFPIDNKPPSSGYVIVANTNGATNDPTPDMQLLSTGASEMRFALSQAGLDTAAWIPYAENHSEFDISAGGDGSKQVWVQFRDSMGNVQLDPSVDDIMYDSTPPNSPVFNEPAAAETINDTTPTWSWRSGGDGDNVYRYELKDSGGAILSSGQTSDAVFTPSFSLGQGAYTLAIKERDRVGNWSDATSSPAYIIDLTPPSSVSISGAPTGTVNVTSATFTVSGADVKFYRYNFNNSVSYSSERPVGDSFFLTGLPDGLNTLSVIGRDAAGNWQQENQAATVSWTVDTVPPVITGLSDSDTPANGKTWIWSATDATGPVTYRFSIDTSSTGIPTGDFTNITTATQPVGDGAYYLHVQARDSVGNESPVATVHAILDNTPPTVSPIPDDGTPTRIKEWHWTGTDALDDALTFRYRIDQSESGVPSGEYAPVTSAIKSDVTGIWYIHVQARDRAGNESAVITARAVLDNAPPVITGLFSDTTPRRTQTWTWGALGEARFRFKIDQDPFDIPSGDFTDITTATTPTGADGAWYLHVQARDPLGNTSEVLTVYVILDNIPPDAPSVWGVPLTADTTPVWNWEPTSEAGIEAFRFRLDNADLTSGAQETSGRTFTPPAALTDGVHTLYVQQQDAAGNWSASGSANIVVDTTAGPPPAVQGPELSAKTQCAFSWSSAGGSGQFRYNLDNGAWSTDTGQLTVTLSVPERTHLFCVQEMDAVGNPSAAGCLEVEVDTGAPCSLAAPPAYVDVRNTTFDLNYTFGEVYDGETCLLREDETGLSGSGLDRVELWVRGPDDTAFTLAATDASGSIDGRFSYTAPPAAEGTYTFFTQAHDRAGNPEHVAFPPNGDYLKQTIYSSDFAGYAILSVGSISGQEGLASHTLTANNVYKHLINQNFGVMGDPADPLDHIKYYNPYDEPQSGEDEYTGGYWLAMQKAVTEWALDRMRVLPGPLYLIFIDHGSPDTLYLTGTEHLLPQELDDWLSTLESGMAAAGIDEDIVVILGTCFSGSFIDALSGPGRIIVTSTPADEPSYRGPKDPGGVRDGEFFITALFNGLGRGLDLAQSFEGAVDLTETFTDSGYPETPAPYFDTARQHPMLDDNGDGVGSNRLTSGDGAAAEWMYLGYGADGVEPVTVTGAGSEPDVPLTSEAEALLWAEVNDPSRADSVWVEIREPGLTLEGGDAQQTVELVERPMALNAGANRYEVNYYNFTTPGTYTLYFYVRDTQGLISPFQRAFVYKSLAGNVAPDPFQLTLPADGAEVAAVFVLDWDDASDPDGDRITYTVRIAAGDDPGFAAPVVEIEGLERSLCRIDQAEYGLADTTDYLWQVLAVDEYGARTPNHPPAAGQPHGTFSTNFQNPVPAWFEGHVYNTATGQPIGNVSVEIGGDASDTDTGGYFLDEVTPGTYSLTVTADGYQPASQDVNLPAGELTSRSIGLNIIIQPGDVNGDGEADLDDAVLALQVTAGVTPAAAVYAEADVDGDGKIGMGEALFAMQAVAGLR